MKEITTITFDNKEEAIEYFADKLDGFINLLEDKINKRGIIKDKTLFKIFTFVYDRLTPQKLCEIVSKKLLVDEIKKQVKGRNDQFFIENYNLFNDHLKDEHLEFLKTLWLNKDNKGFDSNEKKDLWLLFDDIIITLEYIKEY